MSESDLPVPGSGERRPIPLEPRESLPPIPALDLATPRLWPQLRGIALVGLVLIGLFFGGLGAWAAMAPLATVSVAPGSVGPEGSRRTVQHLEGGIILDILVKDGDVVAAGQPLVVMDEVQARTQAEALTGRRYSLGATLARLEAERDGKGFVSWPEWIVADAKRRPEAAAALRTQEGLFRARRIADQQRVRVIEERIAQLEAQIAGSVAQAAAIDEQKALIAEEIATVEDLLKKGLERMPRLLALRRAAASLEGERRAADSAAAVARREIAENRVEMANLAATRLEETGAQLSEVQLELVDVEQKIRSAEDIVARKTVRAPIDGTVVDLRFKTEGGVIQPGEPILDVVPKDERLVIRAQVPPQDIDVVHPGLTATVHFPAFKQRNLARMEGKVTRVAADVTTERETGHSYYLASIEVDPAVIRNDEGQLELKPGMPAEAIILTGERTVLDYVFRPLLDATERAFREE